MDHLRKNSNVTYAATGRIQKTTINTHRLSAHSQEKSLKCSHPGCSYKTNFSVVMKRHLLTHGENLKSQYPFACTFPGCDFRRRSKIEILQHAERHETNKVQLTCKLCRKSAYPDTKSLHFHSFKYHNQKSIKCSMCDYAVCHLSTLQVHMRKQHGSSVQLKLPVESKSGI